jgi:flagellar motor switch protein FliM
MADVLSQSEVDSLLAALDPGAGGGASLSAGPAIETTGTRPRDYDLQGPDRVNPKRISPAHMRTLQDGLGRFSREFGLELSAMLRTIVEVRLNGLGQLAYSEFTCNLENPTCFNLLKADAIERHAVLDLNPSIVYPILDRLLGGELSPRLSTPPRRQLTEIELRLVTRITAVAISALGSGFANVGELKLRVMQVEKDPRLVPFVPPNEVVLLATFEILLGEMSGILSLCIPLETLGFLVGNPADQCRSSSSQQQAGGRQVPSLETEASNARLEMIVYLAGTRLTAGELMGLSVGDTIVTDKDCREPLEVCVNGQPRFNGFAGLVKGHTAVRITQAIAAPEVTGND